MGIPAYRLSFPRRTRCEIRWRREHRLPRSLRFLLDELAQIPGVRYEPGWTAIEAAHTAWNLSLWHALLEATGNEEAFVEKMPLPATDGDLVIEGLYPHQADAVARATANGYGLLLADQMGLGKTRTAIFAAMSAAMSLGREDDPIVIVGPGFARDTWRRELRACGVLERDEDFCPLYTRDPRHKSYRPGARWYFLHYDVVQAWASRLQSARRRPVAVIADEIHWAKNPRAQRSKGLQTLLGSVPFRMGLTGTPLANRIDELYWPMTCVTGAHTWGSLLDFRRRYAGAVRGPFGWEDREPSNLEELRHRLKRFYLRRTVDDLPKGQLPDLTRTALRVPLSDTLQRAHDGLLPEAEHLIELLDALREGRAGKDTLALMGSLRTVTGDAKRAACVEHVGNVLQQGESVVVFVWRRATATSLVERLVRQGFEAVAVHGGLEQEERDASVVSFQAGEGSARALVATYGALREGVTLTRARHVVLHDLDWSPPTVLQAEARVWRLGQQRGCTSTWLLSPNSMDELVAGLLVEKARVIAQTLDIETAASAFDGLGLPDLAGLGREVDLSDWGRDLLRTWRSDDDR